MNCLLTFKAELHEIRQMRQFYQMARYAMKRYWYKFVELANQEGWSDDVMSKTMPEIPNRQDCSESKSHIVMAWGCFERFVRNALEEGAGLRNSLGWGDEGIPEGVKNQHTIACADALCGQIRGTKIAKLDVQDVSNDLHLVNCSDRKAKLNEQALAAIGGRFDENELEFLGKRIGVELSWQEMAKNEELISHSGKDSAASASQWAKSRFCEIRDLRNTFAHTGYGPDECDAENVESSIEFLEILAGSIADSIDSQIREVNAE